MMNTTRTLAGAMALALMTAGCAQLEVARPFVEKARDALLATCRTLDGAEVTVAVDTLAAQMDVEETIAEVRRLRQMGCVVTGVAGALMEAGNDG